MRRLLVLLTLVVGTAAIAPVPVSAQERAADADARALFEAGRTAYDAGRFDEATRAFRRAYLLSARYQLLYNIGQTELRAGRDPQALEAFEAFLRQASVEDPNRSEVEERVRILRAMGVTSAPPPEANETSAPEVETTENSAEPEVSTLAVETAEPAAPADEGPGAAPWILVGGGGAALVGGAILMGVGVAESSRVTGATDGARWADLEGASSSANVLWGVGIGVAALGLAATAGGLVWALSAPGSSDGERAATARLRIAPTGLAIEGVF